MEAPKYLLAPVILALLSGCAAKSMVVSKRATGIEEGMIYSLPKQLVKITYKRNTEDLEEKKVCEELTINAEDPIPDTDNTFYATIEHWITSSDILEISTANGLLAGAIGHSEDKTGDIVVSLAGSLAGLGIAPSPSAIPKALQPSSAALEACEKKAISITQDIEPCGNRLNQRSLCSKLDRASRERAAEGESRWREPIPKICGIV